jgi:transmembrane sensor
MSIDRIYDEAAGWLVRQQDDAMDWEGFTAWLEADPRHREAYDEIALIDARIDEHSERLRDDGPVSLPVAANDPEPVRWGRWAGLGGGAIAAGLALTIALQPMRHEVPAQDYRSVPGHVLQVALSGGTKVLLAPASHLTVKGEKLAIEGTGYFDVPHQPGRALTINAGDFTVTDIGTRFSVGNEADGVSVDVADGSLAVTSARLGAPIGLSAGHGLRASSSGMVRLVQVEPRQVATWRTGELQFDQVPLKLVARDISRYSGRNVTVDPAIAEQPFSGVIAIDDGEAPARTLAQILSLDVKAVDGTLRLEPRRR